jgi:enoyl-CoA hydratase/carnithine racemase
MDYKQVEISKKDHKAWLTLIGKTLTPEFYLEFHSIMTELEQDDDVWVIMVKSTPGPIFFAGANIKNMKGVGMTEADLPLIKGNMFEASRCMNRLEFCPKPIIVGVDGFALGGGCEFCIACDIIIASDKATFGFPEVKIGLIPAAGGTQRLPRRIGKQKAMEMLLTGKFYKAEEAFQMGLLNRVVTSEALLEEVEKMADLIVQNSPVAVRATKATTIYGETIFDRQIELDAIEKSLYRCMPSEDFKEGVTAFVTKRKPVFKNK